MYDVQTVTEEVSVPAEASLFKDVTDEQLLELGVPMKAKICACLYG